MQVGFENMLPQSIQFITALAANIDAGTHTKEIVRYSGSVNDPRSRLVQTAVKGGSDFEILMEGYGAGDAFNILVSRGYLKGGWVDADTWEGEVNDTAVETYRAG